MTDDEDDDDLGLTEALAAWGLTPTQIADTLEATDFAFGLVELRPPTGEPSPGVAIVVDDRRDPKLRDLFAWRAEAGEDAYHADWETGDAPMVRVVLGPDEQALVRLGVTIRRPAALERRYLFAVHSVAPLLAKMQVPGAGIWLAPATVIEKHAAVDPPPDTYDVTDRCLRVAVCARAVPSIDEALAHVGAPRESEEAPPMNRAERRAAARKKKD